MKRAAKAFIAVMAIALVGKLAAALEFAKSDNASVGARQPDCQFKFA